MKEIAPIFLDISEFRSLPDDENFFYGNEEGTVIYDRIDGPQNQRATYKPLALEQPLLIQKAISDIGEHIGASVARSYLVINDQEKRDAPKYGFISMHGSKTHQDSFQISEKFRTSLSQLRESLNTCALIRPEIEPPEEFDPDSDLYPDSESQVSMLMNLQAKLHLPNNAVMMYLCGVFDAKPYKAIAVDENLNNPYQFDFGLTVNESSEWNDYTLKSEKALIQEARETLKDVAIEELLFYVERLIEYTGEFKAYVQTRNNADYCRSNMELNALVQLGERIIQQYGQIMERDMSTPMKEFQSRCHEQMTLDNENLPS